MINFNLQVVRLGHPARVTTELQKFSLDAILTSRDSSDIIRSVRSDITAAIVSMAFSSTALLCEDEHFLHYKLSEISEL